MSAERIGIMRLVDKLSNIELQSLVLNMPMSPLCKLCGVTRAQMDTILRNQQVKGVIAYLKTMDKFLLREQLAIFGSISALAKKFRVSKSFIKSLLWEPPVDSAPHAKIIQEEWDKFGSLKIVAGIHGMKLSEVAKIVRENNLVKPRNFEFEAKTTHVVGRKGEIEYLKFRGLTSEHDMTYTDPNAPFDVNDPVYGKVNVKASHEFRYKSKSRVWNTHYKFDLQGWNNCDSFAFMCYGKDEFLKRVYVVPVMRWPKRNGGSFILNSQAMYELRDCLKWIAEDAAGWLSSYNSEFFKEIVTGNNPESDYKLEPYRVRRPALTRSQKCRGVTGFETTIR